MVLGQVAISLTARSVRYFRSPCSRFFFTTRLSLGGASFRGLPFGGIKIRLAIMCDRRYPSEKRTRCRELAGKDCAGAEIRFCIDFIAWGGRECGEK